MSKLFRDMFAGHGPVYEYPRVDQLAGYEWSLDCDLDSSFDFLLAAKLEPMRFVSDEKSFWSFLAGFFDAEGSIVYHRKGRRGAFELILTNSNLELLRRISEKLLALGFTSVIQKVRVNRLKAIESGIANPSEFMWRIGIWQYENVSRLLRLLPLRHAEKEAKVAIALRLGFRETRANRRTILEEWKSPAPGDTF
jgi:hypothetical protein